MIRRNLFANYLGQGWNALMGFAFVPLYIKYLGIESFGLIGVFSLLVTWLGLLDLGMLPTLGREMAHFTGGSHSVKYIRDLLRSAEIIVFGLAIVVAVSIYISSPILAKSWLQVGNIPISIVSEALAIMGLVAALRFAEGVYRSSIIGLQKQVLYNVVNSAMSTLRSVGAVAILIWVSPTVQAFFIWQGIVSIFTLIVFAIATYARIPKAEQSGRFSSSILKSIWGFASGMLLLSLLTMLVTQLDKILLSKLLSLADYGYYSMTTLLAGSLFNIITPVISTFYPKFCEMHAKNDHNGLADVYHKASQVVSVLAGSAAIFIIFFSDTVLYIWTQDKVLTLKTSLLLKVLLSANLLNCLIFIPYYTQLAFGWTKLAIYINTISIFIVVPLLIWSTRKFGAIGAAWVYVGLFGCYLLLGLQFMYRRILIGEKWSWYLKDIALPMSIGVITVLLLRMIIPEGSSLKLQIIQVIVSFAITVLAMLLGASHLRKQLCKYLSEMKRFVIHKTRPLLFP